MSIRLQVVMEDAELREIRRAARRRQMTVSEWVRHALRAARREEPEADPGRRLDAIRAAVRHEFPTGGVEQILDEIAHGRADDSL